MLTSDLTNKTPYQERSTLSLKSEGRIICSDWLKKNITEILSYFPNLLRINGVWNDEWPLGNH